MYVYTKYIANVRRYICTYVCTSGRAVSDIRTYKCLSFGLIVNSGFALINSQAKVSVSTTTLPEVLLLLCGCFHINYICTIKDTIENTSL